MKCSDMKAAIANKYGHGVDKWSLRKGYHRKLKTTDSGIMVSYSTDGGVCGNMWLETMKEWAAGNTDFMYDPDNN